MLTEGSLFLSNTIFIKKHKKVFKQKTFQIKKMTKNKVNMPSGTAGLTRYFDEYKSKIQFKPGYVIIFVIVVIIIIALLHFSMSNFFGV